MYCSTCVLILFPLACVSARLTVRPADIAVVQDEQVSLNCTAKPTTATISWFAFGLHGSESPSGRLIVGSGCKVQPDFVEHFTVRKDVARGQCDLIINRAEKGLAATYRCVDSQSGVGEATVTISSAPHGDITYQADEKTSFVVVTCSVSYNGKTTPQIEWNLGGIFARVTPAPADSKTDIVSSIAAIPLSTLADAKEPISCYLRYPAETIYETHSWTTGIADLNQVACGMPIFAPLLTSPKLRIVGGQEAVAHSWPWQCAVGQYRVGGYVICCGCSVINNRWVITAAHCACRIDLIIVGAHDLRKPTGSEQQLRVKQRIVHDLWKGGDDSNHNDIALIEVSPEIQYNKFVRPVCLPSDDIRDFPTTTECIVTGWGKTLDPSLDEHLLRQVLMPIQTWHDCQSFSDYYADNVDSSQVCAGKAEGDAGPCLGDSGGPLVCKSTSDGTWKLVGLTSYGADNGGEKICGGMPNPLSVYTRVQFYKEWITSKTSPANMLTPRDDQTEEIGVEDYGMIMSLDSATTTRKSFIVAVSVICWTYMTVMASC